MGQNGVWIFDTKDTMIIKQESSLTIPNNNKIDNNRIEDNHGDLVSYENILLTRLSDGDVLDMNTYEVIYASYKQPMVETSIPVDTSNDIFQEDTFEFDKILISLLQR